MITIDGSQKSGSGTIVRDAVAFSVLMGKNLCLKNIRAKRAKPGLRAQHLKGIEASAQFCSASYKGLRIGSKEISFMPGQSLKGGNFIWDIGTAGSTTMLALNVIPLTIFADEPTIFKVSGGLFQDFAPSVYHLKYVLLPILSKMGIDCRLEIIQPGYVPKGNGKIEVKSFPIKTKLKPINRIDQGKIIEIKGIALSSELKFRKVSERMAQQCLKTLNAKGYHVDIDVIYDSKEKPYYQGSPIQAGAALAVWARTDTGCLIGSDIAGALGRPAEFIGEKVAENLIEDLKTGAAVDRHSADQLIPFAALAEGSSVYLIPKMTEHVEARLWLVEKILGAKTEVKNKLIKIRGIGYSRVK
ncbi:MAG: RNA 3'-phosphate cyclase [Desulfobacterales bacterium]|nr:RNA 3'-phosphate cyclase [Desulfobacterales bacterium]